MAKVGGARPAFYTCSPIHHPLRLFLIFAFFCNVKVHAQEANEADRSGSPNKVAQVKSGPWGDLQYFEIDLVAPNWMVELFELPSTDTIWRFPGLPLQQLSEKLLSMQFKPAQLQWISEPGRLLLLEDEICLHPPDSLIASMTPDQRLAIHRVLSQWEENTFHFQPVYVRSDNAKTWFRKAGLSNETADLIASLCFEVGDHSVFTEVEFVMKQVGTRQAEYQFIRSLTRTRGIIARLAITEQSDLTSIADYWRGFGKRKSISPILEAIAATPGVDHLDIVHLLPPTPRKLLNTYPDLKQSRGGKFPDSLWMAANFYRFEPSDRFLNVSEVLHEFETLYDSAEGQSRFGDVVLLFEEGSKEPIHAAVRIADDIVYTKSGKGIFAPFLLMKQSELLSTTSNGDAKIFVKTLRRRPTE